MGNPLVGKDEGLINPIRYPKQTPFKETRGGAARRSLEELADINDPRRHENLAEVIERETPTAYEPSLAPKDPTVAR